MSVLRDLKGMVAREVRNSLYFPSCFHLLFLAATCGSTRCSGHGECITTGSLAYPFSFHHFTVYRNWDANQTTSCRCYDGYSGADCSLSEFPISPYYFPSSLTLSLQFKTCVLKVWTLTPHLIPSQLFGL